jgi:Holliday junction DNA helicase RuvA
MIARIRGPVLSSGGGRVVIEAAGVGYELQCPESVCAACIEGAPADLFARMVVREDDISLYGFSTREQKALFDLLREVKGCGARISLALLGLMPEDALAAAIAAQDAAALARAPGVGARLAERIIVDLREKAAALASPGRQAPARAPEPPDELVQALMALGYRRGELDDAMLDECRKAGAAADQVREALRRLAR